MSAIAYAGIPSAAATFQGIVYRADIDGLRAVAVLAVVAFHAVPGVLPGGFTGVDVFFVISGFLISSLILVGLHDGSFNFYDFYARRAKRIFPALIVVLATALVLGWLLLLPDEYRQLGRHAMFAAAFVDSRMRSRLISRGTTVASIVPSRTSCGTAEGPIGGSPQMS